MINKISNGEKNIQHLKKFVMLQLYDVLRVFISLSLHK